MNSKHQHALCYHLQCYNLSASRSHYQQMSGVWVADVEPQTEINSLFVDGKRQILARWPNGGTPLISTLSHTPRPTDSMVWLHSHCIRYIHNLMHSHQLYHLFFIAGATSE
jgi:hypothetical protein